MSDEFSLKNEDVLLAASSGSVDSVQEIMQKFMDTARVEAVYGKPVQHGNTLIIPTAEVLTGMGFGLGFGGGSNAEPEDEESVAGEEPEQAAKHGGSGAGGGGGGGGQSLSRPVAVIIADENGVRIEPVMDITKVALAALTAFGFAASMLARMRTNKLT